MTAYDDAVAVVADVLVGASWLAFWGHDPRRTDGEGRAHQRWRIRKGRFFPGWWVTPPNANESRKFETFPEALEWATSLTARVEHWLEKQ